MMKVLVCDASPDFFQVKGVPKEVNDYIFRLKKIHRYIADSTWHVHFSRVISVVQLAYEVEGHVDYSMLPDFLQMQIAKKKPQWRKGTKKSNRPQASTIDKATLYGSLYLTPDAPPGVVKAVYRHLAKEHHPDRGGDEEEFKRVANAYSKILEE